MASPKCQRPTSTTQLACRGVRHPPGAIAGSPPPDTTPALYPGDYETSSSSSLIAYKASLGGVHSLDLESLKCGGITVGLSSELNVLNEKVVHLRYLV